MTSTTGFLDYIFSIIKLKKEGEYERKQDFSHVRCRRVALAELGHGASLSKMPQDRG